MLLSWGTFLGLVIGLGFYPLARWVFRLATWEVEDEHTAVVTSFGKTTRVLQNPGLYFIPNRILPWVHVFAISHQRDFRQYPELQITDKSGMTVFADLWVEVQVKDSEKSLFEVEDWEEALENLVLFAATSILGKRDFLEILQNRNELEALLKQEIEAETSRWGIKVNAAMIRNLGVLPEVAKLLFESVSAQLERARALIDEEGRLQVAELNARAKTQYPLAVGRAFNALRNKTKVLSAYEELYRLSQLQPGKIIYFQGFEAGEMRAVEAAMMTGNHTDSPSIGRN